ncbi:hypothetical protein [Streptomyces sp. AK02-04a]|uniref:hypothetical protein n=1 Tax=Streptomyces TaxID=1883 RepID=UPI0039F610D9
MGSSRFSSAFDFGVRGLFQIGSQGGDPSMAARSWAASLMRATTASILGSSGGVVI